MFFIHKRLRKIIKDAKQLFSLEFLDKEISDIIAFNQVKEFLPNLAITIFEDEISILLLINIIINTIRRFAMKSIRKGDKSVAEILNYIAI